MSLKHYSAGQIRLPDSRGRVQLGRAHALALQMVLLAFSFIKEKYSLCIAQKITPPPSYKICAWLP